MYSSYPATDPNPMTTSQKCALGLILDPHMTTLSTKNRAAVTSGGSIKNAISGIYTNQNALKNAINTKTTEMETFRLLDYYWINFAGDAGIPMDSLLRIHTKCGYTPAKAPIKMNGTLKNQ